MPFPSDTPSNMAAKQMVDAIKAGATIEIPDMEIDYRPIEARIGVLMDTNVFPKCHVLDSVANVRPVEARDLFDPALQKATMYALGCNSMKEVKVKFGKKCACGSGKKFKNCCLQKVLNEANAEEAPAAINPDDSVYTELPLSKIHLNLEELEADRLEFEEEEPESSPTEAKPVRGVSKLHLALDDLAYFGGEPGERGSHPPYREEIEGAQ